MTEHDPWRPSLPGLGETQRAVLGILREHGPLSLSEVGRHVGRSRETLRHHMESLARQGLVERAGSEGRGRGRPEVLYRLAAEGRRLFPSRETEVLRELVEFLLRRGDAALLETFFSQRARRKRAQAEVRLEGLEGEARLQGVADVLTREGFLARVDTAPSGEGPDAKALRIVHCPLEGLIESTKLPCRAELDLVAELLGRSLSRLEFMPAGGRSCSYAVAPSNDGAAQ